MASDPFAAASRIAAEVPDVIALDVEIPRMDGITFLRKLMAQHPIPMVMCSTLVEAVAETSRRLEDAASRLMALPAAQAERRALMERMAEQHAGLARVIGAMRRNLAYMRAYSFNVKITAAGVAGAEVGFDVFAQEISERIEAGHGEMDHAETAQEELLRGIEAALLRADALEAGCAALIPAVPDRLVASVATSGWRRRRWRMRRFEKERK